MKKIQAQKMLKFEIISFICSLTVLLLPLAFPNSVRFQESVTYALLVYIIISFIIIRFKIPNISEGLTKLHLFFEISKKDFNFEKIDLSDDLVRRLSEKILDDFNSKLVQAAIKKFTIQHPTISEIGLRMVDDLNKSGFATLIVSETLNDWHTDNGEKAQEICDKALKRMKSRGGDFTRVFIVEDNYEFTPLLHKMLEEQHIKGYNVLIAYKDKLKKIGLPSDYEIAIWDKKYFITVQKLNLERKRQIDFDLNPEITMRKHDELVPKFKDKSISISYEKFLSNIREPFTKKRIWEEILRDNELLIPPMTPSKSDLSKYRKLILESNNISFKRCLVLGQTPELVGLMIDLNFSNIDVIDFVDTENRLKDFDRKINRITCNWLEYDPKKKKYDFIIGDQVTNNLAIWQYHLFFSRMSSLLSKKGSLILRVAGNYCNGNSLLDINFEEIMNKLIGEYSDRNSLIKNISSYKKLKLRYLFSSEAYDNKNKSCDTAKWNEKLDDYVDSNKLDSSLYDRFKYDLEKKSTSITGEEFDAQYKGYFTRDDEVIPSNEDDELDRNFYRFYRLLNNSKKKMI